MLRFQNISTISLVVLFFPKILLRKVLNFNYELCISVCKKYNSCTEQDSRPAKILTTKNGDQKSCEKITQCSTLVHRGAIHKWHHSKERRMKRIKLGVSGQFHCIGMYARWNLHYKTKRGLIICREVRLSELTSRSVKWKI